MGIQPSFTLLKYDKMIFDESPRMSLLSGEVSNESTGNILLTLLEKEVHSRQGIAPHV